MSNPYDVMVIAAHPDDTEFGVAGTVARWTGTGKRVIYVVCTSGEKGTAERGMDPWTLAGIREREQTEAAEKAGVDRVVFLRYPDQGLEETPAFRKHLSRLIRTHRPQLVVTSDPYRRYLWHRDHRILGQVAMDAVFPCARDHLAYPDLLAEGLDPHQVPEIWFWGADDVNHRSDISETIETKLEALACHRSQFQDIGFDKVERWVRRRCEEAASGEPFAFAEGFHRVEVRFFA